MHSRALKWTGYFFILTHLGHSWNTGTLAPKVHKRGTRGVQVVHERGTRGASLNLPTTNLIDLIYV